MFKYHRVIGLKTNVLWDFQGHENIYVVAVWETYIVIRVFEAKSVNNIKCYNKDKNTKRHWKLVVFKLFL